VNNEERQMGGSRVFRLEVNAAPGAKSMSTTSRRSTHSPATCLGRKSGTGYDSSDGTTTTTAGTTATLTNAGTTATSGMGDNGAQAKALGGSGVMFVEINYLTEPLFGTWLTSPGAHPLRRDVYRPRPARLQPDL